MEERYLGYGYIITSGQYKWAAWLANELEETILKNWWQESLGYTYVKGPVAMGTNEPSLIAWRMKGEYI